MSPAFVERLHGINIYLVGMMGVGKSTLGRLLAQQLGYQFFDTDTVIEQAAKQPIPKIFETQGEDAFRALETQVLAELSAYTRLTIATGGGIVTRRENWSHLRQGLVIWLDISETELLRRLQNDRQRPLLQTADPQARLRQLMSERRSRYALADLHIAPLADSTPQQTLDTILTAIPTVLRSLPALSQPPEASQ
ncbi:MAG: shikimate kinase [Cyanobacteria bacterium P01_H01_bin.121]